MYICYKLQENSSIAVQYIIMDQFDLQAMIPDKQDCFFAKLLRECSMDDGEQIVFGQPEHDKELHDTDAKKERDDEKMPVLEFMRWKGLQDSDQQDTSQPEPQLMKAQSLRLEQQRKISSFIDIFGNSGVDPLTGRMKTFSPQKHKKIVKGSKK